MRILVVEDDANIAAAIRRELVDQHYSVDVASDGMAGEDLALSNDYDLILLDLMLPKKDGRDVCKSLREDGLTTPILMMTALGEAEDTIHGLDAGADDYLVKPYAMSELAARLRALLRRTSVSGADDRLVVGDLVLDPSARLAWRDGDELELTKTEFDLLELLLFNAGVVLSRDTIYSQIWGYDFETTSRSLDVYVGYLRTKTEAGGRSRVVHTVRGVGYVVRNP